MAITYVTANSVNANLMIISRDQWRVVRGSTSAFILLDSWTSKVKSLLVRNKINNPTVSCSNLILN